jgi:hypothetical protein
VFVRAKIVSADLTTSLRALVIALAQALAHGAIGI